MKIWVYLNGVQQGPYSLEEFQQLDLSPSTPVWYEGLPQWMPASEAPVTASMFQVTGNHQSESADSVTEETIEQAEPAVASLSLHDVAPKDAPPAPPTFIGWSVFAMICCNPLGGVLGIIFSIMSGNAYREGDYGKAARMSEYAEWAIILSIVLGLLALPLAIIIL